MKLKQQPDCDMITLELADEFLQALRAGAQPSIEEFAKRAPGREQKVREAISDVLFVEQALTDRTEALHVFVPKQLGGYQIDYEIGRGGMGVVYAATDPLLERKLAIKTILRDSDRLRLRFEREAQLASRLNHPNIVPLLESSEHHNSRYLVMPLIEGKSLGCILDDPYTPEAQALLGDWSQIAAIGAQVASALQCAHQSGMIHRDIKPANLILDSDQKIWVTDFGLAKLRDSNIQLSISCEIIGTLRYMAPEQVVGSADERSDIFSLGLTLYELAVGRKVLGECEDALSRLQMELPGIREVNPAIPQELADIIHKACDETPEERYQSAEEFQYELNRFAHGQESKDRRVLVNNSPLIGDWLLVPVLVGLLGFIFYWYASYVMRTRITECTEEVVTQSHVDESTTATRLVER